MTHLRLSLPALALVLAGSWTAQATACDKDKATATTAVHASSAAKASACGAKESATAVTASARSAKSASMDCCAMKSTKSATARNTRVKGTAVIASSSGCAGMMDAAMASADHCAGGASKTTAVVAGSGGMCSSKGSATSARMASNECDACSDMVLCNGELETAGTRTQVVPLKNGVMFVYTAEQAGNATAVQSAMARRSARLSQIVTAGDRAHLCADCKMVRGAIASGKMTREVINIEGGALTLMTSTDPLMVKKIRAMVDGNKIARKS